MRHAGGEQRVLEQGAAVVHLLCSNVLEPAQLALRSADACDVGALVSEQKLGVGPAAIFFADAVLDRYAHVLEPHFVHFMCAVERDDRSHGDAGGLHVDQQERDALLLLGCVRIRAHEAEDPVGVLAECVPGLLSVDDVVLAFRIDFAFRARLQRSEVRACTRFGIPLTPPVFAAQDAGQKSLLLLAGAERHDHRRHHLQAEWNRARRTGSGGFLFEDVQLDRTPVSAAEFLRPCGRAPTLLEKNALPARVILSAQSAARMDALADVGGQPGLQERADFIAEGQFVGSEIQIHWNTRPALWNLSFRCRRDHREASVADATITYAVIEQTQFTGPYSWFLRSLCDSFHRRIANRIVEHILAGAKDSGEGC